MWIEERGISKKPREKLYKSSIKALAILILSIEKSKRLVVVKMPIVEKKNVIAIFVSYEIRFPDEQWLQDFISERLYLDFIIRNDTTII